MNKDMRIGEIREFEGKKYQCLKAICGCYECVFDCYNACSRNTIEFGCCTNVAREDNQAVIFKEVKE